MHATAAMWCMERGKHVYVEKPLTRTVWEARQLAEAAAKYGVATQMGNQGYSNNGADIAAEILWSGEIGNVTEVHAFDGVPIGRKAFDGDSAGGARAPRGWTGTWAGSRGRAPVHLRRVGQEYARTGSSSPGGFYLPFNWRGFSISDPARWATGASTSGRREHGAATWRSPESVEVTRAGQREQVHFPARSYCVYRFRGPGNMPAVRSTGTTACTARSLLIYTGRRAGG